MPTVSVILPTYSRNRCGSLARSIDSVLCQDYRDLELFIVDDGSTDGTENTIQQYLEKDSRVHHIRFKENVSLPALTSAKAFAHSSGSYIAWQFDDCQWRPNHLSSLVSALSNSDAGVAYGCALLRQTEDSSTILGDKFCRSRLLSENYIPNVCALIRREVFDTCGWFDPHLILKRICDWDMWVRASRDFNFLFVNDVLAEENGPSLPDSLENSSYLSDKLAHKYMALERNYHLHITRMDLWDPFWTPGFVIGSLKADFLFMVTEHALFTGKSKLAIGKFAELDEQKCINESSLIKWFMRQKSSREAQIRSQIKAWALRVEGELIEAREYARQQEHQVHAKGAYIRELEHRLHVKEGYIRELECQLDTKGG